MVFLKTDDLAGNMDSFGKDKMIQNVLMPKITKIATQAGLLLRTAHERMKQGYFLQRGVGPGVAQAAESSVKSAVQGRQSAAADGNGHRAWL